MNIHFKTAQMHIIVHFVVFMPFKSLFFVHKIYIYALTMNKYTSILCTR